jgi:transcriptional regulator with XRE-family HTH domain
VWQPSVMTDIRRPLGEMIREQRRMAQLSLRELSRMTRVSNAYLSQVERGLHEPSVRVLSAVAQALDVPLESMMGTPRESVDEHGLDSGVERAIRLDPRLEPEDRAALLTIYRSLVHKEATPDADADATP